MSSWRTVKLGDICRFKYGEMPKKTDLSDDGYPVFSGYRLVGYSTRYHYRESEIIVVARGVGGTGDIKMAPPFCFLTNLSIAILIETPDVYKLFLYYRLASTTLWELRTGSAQAQITIEHLKNYEVAFPPLPTQQRIAGILSAYDELIENSQRRIRILESMARALYREWFVHFRFPGHEHHPRVASPLGEIPQGWEVKKLGEISSYINRGITPRYGEEGDSVVINQKCVRDQRLSLEPARRQSKAIPSEKQVCFGDVLINSTGVGTLGRLAQVYENLENCTVDTHVTIARAARNTDFDFYGCCLLSHQETFERLGIGATGQTELGRAAISEIELVAPPTDVQRQFGMAVKGMRLAVVTHSKQIQNLRRTRDLLLPRLLSGQINIDRN
jgi:type I restriction enzyme S subunit